MLFSTLDSTVRKLKLGPHQHLLLSDTVGFIEKLPHQLIASFKSTLEEVKQSDLLLMVVDIGNTNYPNHIKSVKSVLREIDAHRKPIICVFNKVDKVDAGVIKRAKLKYPGSVFISASKGHRSGCFDKKIEQNLQKDYITLTVKLPYSKNKLISSVFEHCQVLNKKYLEDSVLLTLSADSQFYSKLSDYIYKGSLSDY
ncbi:MAG: GTPase [Actinomycetota bacterium]|nr:GTPase [Actinomycetota bacterium]